MRGDVTAEAHWWRIGKKQCQTNRSLDGFWFSLCHVRLFLFCVLAKYIFCEIRRCLALKLRGSLSINALRTYDYIYIRQLF